MKEERSVTIRGEDYTVREISIGEMMPMMSRFDGDESQQAQMDMMKLCVFIDGVAIGDDIEKVGLRVYLKLLDEVMIVNGMVDEGKD